jgi:hypothetical protein
MDNDPREAMVITMETPWNMSTNQRSRSARARRAQHNDDTSVSDTPLWHKYYLEMRKRVKFPRYYKHAVNW